MGSDGVSEVGVAAGDRVDGMVNGTSFHWGLLQGQEPVEVSTEGGMVRRSWVEGSDERMWRPSLRICLRR